MSMIVDLRPGDIMFARHVSPRAADLLILAGQVFLGQPGYPHHVAVVVSNEPGFDRYTGRPVGNPRIVQAMPSGAEEIEIGIEHFTEDYIYLRPPYKIAATGYGGMAERVVEAARGYIGVPYSFADYGALTAHHVHLPVPHLDRFIVTSKHMICSQLADKSMADAGWHVFNDGRLPQDVTPAALFHQMMTVAGTLVIEPGQYTLTI